MHLETCVALLKHRLERPDQEQILTVAQKLKADIAEWAAFWSRPDILACVPLHYVPPHRERPR